MALSELIEQVMAFIGEHPLLVFGVCVTSWGAAMSLATMTLRRIFFVWKKMQKPVPFPESSGRVFGVHDTEEWKTAIKATKESKRLLVVDFYAEWCPPCRVAAPRFGELSEEYPDVDFAKVDVDKARLVASQNEIRSMPTFKIFSSGGCVHTSAGFQPKVIAAELEKLGAKKKTSEGVSVLNSKED